MVPFKTISLDVIGLGIIMYSPSNIPAISDGEDFLSKKYVEPADVLDQVYKGGLVGFGTGSSGRYRLSFFTGYPSQEDAKAAQFSMRLGVHVVDGKLVFRDLYDLMEWTQSYSAEQAITLANGYYHVTLISNMPASGMLGDNQDIWIYLKPLPEMPRLKYRGVPILCE